MIVMKIDVGANPNVCGIHEPRSLAAGGPACTTGVKSFAASNGDRELACGEHRTIIDWWAWRTKAAPLSVMQALRTAFGGAPDELGERPRRTGYQGYKSSADLTFKGEIIGLIAWGGSTQRSWTFVEIFGRGCELVADWAKVQAAVRPLARYEIRRLDIAFDTFDDEHGFEQTLAAYDACQFTRRGRRPKRMFTTWDSPHDGRLIKIGHRGSDQHFRGYEKGKQVLGPALTAKHLSNAEAPAFATLAFEHGLLTPDGAAAPELFMRWWRHELELRPKTRRIPPDAIDDRDQIFAGAYPYLGQLLETVSPIVLPARASKSARAKRTHVLGHVKKQYRRILLAARDDHGGDLNALFAMLTEEDASASPLR